LEVFVLQNKQLLEEYRVMSDELANTQDTYNKSKRKIEVFEGQKEALNRLTIEECEDYEKMVKSTLHKIEERKVIPEDKHYFLLNHVIPFDSGFFGEKFVGRTKGTQIMRDLSRKRKNRGPPSMSSHVLVRFMF
jgi:hypothetical protein